MHVSRFSSGRREAQRGSRFGAESRSRGGSSFRGGSTGWASQRFTSASASRGRAGAGGARSDRPHGGHHGTSSSHTSGGGATGAGQPMFWKPGTSAAAPDMEDRAVEKENNVAVFNPNSQFALSKQRRLLPMYDRRRELLYAVDKYQTVVLVGETGCGKSTQMPQYLDEAGWTVGGRVVGCTQPRQVAAATVAARVADEMGVRLGREVGYAVRFDNCTDPVRTRVKFLTDGVLIRETMLDPLLSRYSVLMIDEAHERSLETDILLGLLKKIKRKREDLRIIVSSATMDADKFKKFFETNKTRDPAKDTAVVVAVQGRQHAVDVMFSQEPVADYVKATVRTVAAIHNEEGEGDILAFLPGQQDIETACQLIRDAVPDSGSGRPLMVFPLYAHLPWRNQLAAMAPLPKKRRRRGMLQPRKVVVATNIAETSVTIDDIVFVVDSGFVKLPVYDPISGMESLIVQPISQDSANQRTGRAGRVRHGKCFRLYPEDAFLALPDATPPEMVRTDLTPAVLQLKALGIDDVAHFDFMDSPPAESLIRALELLFALGALNGQCGLTSPLGYHLAEFPVEPRVAAMLLSSLKMECSEEALTIAAMTSVKSIFAGGLENRRKSDLALREFAAAEGDQITLINVYNAFLDEGKNAAWCRDRGFKYRALMRASEVRRQLRRYLVKLAKQASPADGTKTEEAVPAFGALAELGVLKSAGEDTERIVKCIVAGFFSNAAKLASDGTYRTVKDGRKVVLHPTSVLFRYSQTAPWVVYHDVQLTTEEHMREVVAIKPTWLTELAPQYYEAKDKRKQGHQSTKRKARDAMLPPRTAGILGLLAAEEAEIRGGAGDGRSRTRASGKRMRSVF